ncbi:hypothetical protein AHAS_Ahas02G0138500 [Arachis hypogaea]
MKKMTISKKEKRHYNKTYDLRCSTRSIARVFAELSEEKKTIIEEMEFGALRYIPELNISHKLLRKLILCFDLYHGSLDTCYGKIYITHAKIGCTGPKFRRCYFGVLTKSVMDMSVEGEGNLLKFKMTFIVFIQKCFLLLTIVSTVSPVHKPPVLYVETFPNPEADDAPEPPWVEYWIRRRVVNRIVFETN